MEEEEGRQLRISVQNPLLFDHIVERVISFVDVEFLPSCRLVSRQWEKFALPKLLQNVHKIPVILKGQGNISEDHSKMARYLRYRAENPRLIFNNYTLEKMYFSAPLVDSFMSACAAEITELKLKFDEYQSPETLRRWIPSLVNLKSLTLDVDSRCRPSSMSSPPWNFAIFLYLYSPPRDFSRTLNLKRLCFNDNGTDPVMFYGHLTVALRSCESLDEIFLGIIPWRTLHHYYIPDVSRQWPNALVEISTVEMDSESLEYLIGLETLKLKALSCQSLVLWDRDGEGRFSEFLEKYKSTLESLVVGEIKATTRQERGRARARTTAYEITFPDVMPKLKVFQIGLPAPSSQTTLRTGRIRFPPVNFPVQFPSLEKLILYDAGSGSTKNQINYPGKWDHLRGFFEGSDPHRKLTDLCLPFASLKLRESVGAVFPEITSLKMELGLDQNLHEIWEMFPQLKSLYLTINGDMKKINENRMEGLIAGVNKNNRSQGSLKDIDSDSGLISVANLKDLKYFKLRMIGDCKGELIDFNVTRAFCKLPCLEFLLFSQHDITKRGTRELLKCHPLLKKVVCPVHPEVFKIQRKYLPNNFIPSEFSTEDSVAGCHCSFSK